VQAIKVSARSGVLKIALEAASPGLDLSLERWSLAACAEPLAEATGVKLVVDALAPLIGGPVP